MKQKKTWNKIAYTTNFQNFLRFYLFETPVEETSCRGKTFKEIGWHGSSQFKMLERLLREASSIDEKFWVFVDIDEIQNLSFVNRTDIQYVASSKDKGKVRSMIYAIRNAFAHGSFSQMDNGWYLFENTYHGRLKARMVLSEDTLLSWEKIIKTKPEYFTRSRKAKKAGNNAA